MKIAIGLFTGAALVLGQMAMAQAQVSPATAAALNLSGKYAVLHMENCEAQIKTIKDVGGAVIEVRLVNAGTMSAFNGYTTLTPSSPGAASGTATITQSTVVGGGSVAIDGHGQPWSQSSINQSNVAYSYNGTSFTWMGEVFAMTYGNLVGNVYKTINLVRLSQGGNNQNCLEAMTMTKQP